MGLHREVLKALSGSGSFHTCGALSHLSGKVVLSDSVHPHKSSSAVFESGCPV